MALDHIEMLLLRLDKMEAKLEALDHKFVHRDIVEERLRSQGERIGHLEAQIQDLDGDRKWAVRLVTGSVVLAVLALVIPASGWTP